MKVVIIVAAVIVALANVASALVIKRALHDRSKLVCTDHYDGGFGGDPNNASCIR